MRCLPLLLAVVFGSLRQARFIKRAQVLGDHV